MVKLKYFIYREINKLNNLLIKTSTKEKEFYLLNDELKLKVEHYEQVKNTMERQLEISQSDYIQLTADFKQLQTVHDNIDTGIYYCYYCYY